MIQQNGIQQIHIGETRTNLIVNYLPQNMTQDDVRRIFSTAGEVESCKLIRDKVSGQSLGYCFVNFYHARNAEQAIKSYNGLKLQNKIIKVSYARPSMESIKGANLYVSGFPKYMTQLNLEHMFIPYGKIITSRILTENNHYMDPHLSTVVPQSKGVGFIRFDQRHEAENAIHCLNGTMPEGFTEPLVVKFANNPANASKIIPNLATYIHPQFTARIAGQLNPLSNRFRYIPFTSLTSGKAMFNIAKGMQRYSPLGDIAPDAAAAVASSTAMPTSPVLAGTGWSIFVYNLAPETEESLLWQLFGPFGAVQSVKVIRDPQTNKCKGFGFVTMTNYDEAAMAIQSLNGYTVGSRILQVSFKTNKTKL